jgi:hypothetical protein
MEEGGQGGGGGGGREKEAAMVAEVDERDGRPLVDRVGMFLRTWWCLSISVCLCVHVCVTRNPKP